MWQSGCGILSTVNAVNYLTGNFIPPTELAQWAYSNNYFNGTYGQGSVRALLYSNVTAAFGSKYGFSVSNLTYDTIYSTTLKNHLIGGGTAIVHCPNHFMAINAYNASTGQYLVYDSAANESVRQTTVDGTWLTADQIHANTNIRVDWFCLVTKTVSATPNTYTVAASVAGGEGTVHFGDNKTSAEVTAGTIINFQVTPADGYAATEILVGGTAYTIQNNGGDAVYQFTMPNGNCGVVVTFSKVGPTLYDVSTSITGGSGTAHFGGGITSAEVTEGTIVNFQTTPASGYKVNEIWVGNTFYTPENNGGDADKRISGKLYSVFDGIT
ncbi:MAG: C39 family peptidase [Faecalimonas sp.]|nr:C39 family peptidase [Faecalimonas sp.]